MRRSLLAVLVLGSASILFAQAQRGERPAVPAAGPAEASHHACLEQERQAIERGEGFGMALAADRSGYPGPRHVLDLRKELKLTPEQVTGTERLYAGMKKRALERGHELLLAEQRLEQMFGEGRSEDELREETYRVASIRAELRWVHLGSHLAARKLLTAEQVATYMRIRHGQTTAGLVAPKS